MKQFPNLFAILFVAVLLCIGCEKKSIVDSIVEMYDDGIDVVDKAASLDDVQKCYNNINEKVEEFKQSHLREMAALDSTVTKIEDAKMIFTKACCIKAFSFDHGYIKDTEGVTIGVNDAGEVLPLESIEGDDGLASDNYEEGNGSKQNPLGFTTITPVFYKDKNYDNTDCWRCHNITVQNTMGDYIYNDGDAERYYEHYLSLFFMAHQIVPTWSEDEEFVNYLSNHLTDIITNLPLDDSYPQNIREHVNKRYYDNKDEVSTLHISERGYGYLKCTYYNNCNRDEPCSFYLQRDKDNNGRFVIFVF